MTDVKWWGWSRGVVGALIAAAPGVLVALGWLSPDEAAQAQAEAGALLDRADELAVAAMSLGGAGLALWGRVRATSAIDARILPRL